VIRIRRTECPDFLRSSRSKVAYRDERVVSELWEMQKHKCCYCETSIPELGHAKAVEHFRPQSIFRSRRNEWNNLLLACPQCNGHKSDEFPVVVMGAKDTVKVLQACQEDDGRPAILDPSDAGTDPEEHLDFVVELLDDLCGLIKARNFEGSSSKIGQRTIEVVGLDSAYYKSEYAKFIRVLWMQAGLLEEARANGDDDGVRRSCQAFEQYMAAGREYSGVARAFVRHFKLERRGVKMPAEER